MVDVKEILARLEKGENLDDIGKELADVLTAASKEYSTIQKKKEAEAGKVKELMAIVDLMVEFINKYYPEDKITKKITEEYAEMDEAALIAGFEKIWKELSILVEGVEQIEKVFKIIIPEDNKKDAVSRLADPDAVIKHFLDSRGW